MSGNAWGGLLICMGDIREMGRPKMAPASIQRVTKRKSPAALDFPKISDLYLSFKIYPYRESLFLLRLFRQGKSRFSLTRLTTEIYIGRNIAPPVER